VEDGGGGLVQEFFEGEGVFYGEAGLVVVEVGVGGAGLVGPFFDKLGPVLEGFFGVFAGVHGLGAVEADVDDVGGDDLGAEPVAAVEDAKAGFAFFEDGVDDGGKPAWVAEFEDVVVVAGQEL